MEIYVHLPFCIKKCEYCDFLSGSSTAAERADYADRLSLEIGGTAQLLKSSGKLEQIDSVFFGGGTPSVMDTEILCELLTRLKEAFRISSQAEISMEVNPKTVKLADLQAYRAAGFNRLSIGCQSMHDNELKLLGRIHTHEDFLECFADARKAGFSNINIDLMSWIPGQNLKSWQESLRIGAELSPEHISAYSLILEEGTPFFEQREYLPLPDEEEERRMYEATSEMLSAFGYGQYEISNYAKEGYECRHNLGYWTGVPYLGFGLGASSYFEGYRYQNPLETDIYYEMCEALDRNAQQPGAEQEHHGDAMLALLENKVEVSQLSKEDQMSEFMFLGLRLLRGVDAKEFFRKFNVSMAEKYSTSIEKYRALGLLEQEGDRLHLTRKGISLSNQVMAEFV